MLELLRLQIEEKKRIGDEFIKQIVATQKSAVESLAILDAMIQLVPVGMAFFDHNLKYLFVNESLAKINGNPAKNHFGKHVAEITKIPDMQSHLIKVRDSNHAILGQEIFYNQVHLMVSYYPVSIPDHIIGIGVAVVDITHRKDLEQELRKRVYELAESDRQKSEFLAMLAHELRNPLAPILNSVHLLNNISTNNDCVSKSLLMIQRQIKHMSRLLDDLLDVARINRGQINLKKEVVDVAALLFRCVEVHQEMADKNLHQLKFENLSDAYVFGDSVRLEQLFNNLLNNAIKYTQGQGNIIVKIKKEGQWVVISLKDDGVGINPESLPKLFEIFVQVNRSLDRTQGGLGIGLAVSQDIARLHGGSIQAKSEGLGKGSEFIVKLPALETKIQGQIDDAINNLANIKHQLSILVVDDNRDAAESMAILLRMYGYDSQIVYDGATALKKVNVYNPHCILLDIGLPGLDGYAVATLLRKTGYNGMIIAVTGYGSDEDRCKSKEAGFDHHLTKPVDLQDLEKLLNNYAKREIQ